MGTTDNQIENLIASEMPDWEIADIESNGAPVVAEAESISPPRASRAAKRFRRRLKGASTPGNISVLVTVRPKNQPDAPQHVVVISNGEIVGYQG